MVIRVGSVNAEVLGTSDVGIEIRRADSRVKGVLAHGYARVYSDPSLHAVKAKTILRWNLEYLKRMRPLNLKGL